jgi:glycosyltransferase involved in cell wall biosynthesis
MEKNNIYEYVPLITVAIPTFNRIDLLKRALASVLAQSYKNIDIIVSDNASTDGTREYLRSIDDGRVKILFNEQNLGMVPNWDCCLACASGDYFLLMSDDDALSDPDALEKLASGFLGDAGKDVGAVFSDVKLERVNQNRVERTFSEKIFYSSEEIIVDFFLNGLAIFPCATLFRTKDIRDFGGYSSFGAKLAVDACAWIFVALKYGKIRRIAEPLALYRIHQSLSSASIETWSAEYEVMQGLVTQNRQRVSVKAYGKIRVAMHAAWSRIPIGYIIKKYREDSKYDAVSVMRDLFYHRKRICSLENIYFIYKRIIRTSRS